MANVWSLLLQCKIHWKAQEAVPVPLLEEGLSYNSVRAATLREYKLVPETYWQTSRNKKKRHNQTFVEFAQEKGA